MESETKVIVDAVENVVDTLKEETEKQVKELLDEGKKVSELVKKEASDLEVRVVEEIKKAQCCLPFAFLFDKYSRSPKKILSRSEESESTVSK